MAYGSTQSRDSNMENLKEKILAEMTVDHADALEKNFETAKNLIRITSKGKTDVLEKNQFATREQILMYLIGKLYAKESELSDVNGADRTELMTELGLPGGTVDPILKKLSDERIIEKNKEGEGATQYSVSINRIEKLLKEIPQTKKGAK